MRTIDLLQDLAPREMGRIIGEELEKDIKHNLHAFRPKKSSNFDTIEPLLRSARKYSSPESWEVLEGIAKGSGTRLKRLHSYQLDNELGCTTLALNQFFGHNEDWDNRFRVYGIRVGQKYIAFGYAGQLPGTLAGLNDKCIAYGVASLSTELKTEGIPINFLTPNLLNATSVDDAIKLATKEEKRSQGVNYLFAGDYIADLELSPDDHEVLSGIPLANMKPTGKGLVHTNHFLSERMRKYEKGEPSAFSPRRFETVWGLIKSIHEPTKGDIMNILRHHQQGETDPPELYSVCYHVGNDTTICSVVMEPKKGYVWFVGGNPCKNNYTRWKLKP